MKKRKRSFCFSPASLLALSLIAVAAQSAHSAGSEPLVLLKNADMLAAESTGVVVAPPSGFDEGTETKLSTDQVNEILPWANNSKIALSDLLESTKELSATQARDVMVRGIQDVVLASAPRRTETLMRYVLNRALKVNREIQTEADTSQPGVIDQQLRLLRQSIRFALRYYQSDVAFLNGVIQKKMDPVVLPFAQFGVEYATFLMALDQSIFDASAQYNVAVMALQLLQWDLYRDQNHLAYAPVIARIDVALKTLPLKSAPKDSDTVALLRQVKKTYLTAGSLLKKLGMKTGDGAAKDEESQGGSLYDYRLDDDIESDVADHELKLILTTCESTYDCYAKMIPKLRDRVVDAVYGACSQNYYTNDKVSCLKRGIEKIFKRQGLLRILHDACDSSYPCYQAATYRSSSFKSLEKGCEQFYYINDKASCFSRGISAMKQGLDPLKVLQEQCGQSWGSCYSVQAKDFPQLERVAAGCDAMYYTTDKAACYSRAIDALLKN